MAKRALITGITGQDGSYLAELLLHKGYEVHGLIRRASTFNTRRIDHLYQDPHTSGARLFLHYGDLASSEQLMSLMYDLAPDEVYHLAAQSHVKVSFDIPEYTGAITALGAVRVLEAVRRTGVKARLYFAASSEMFGESPPPQHEATPFQPANPYAAAKAYAYWLARQYRQGYGMFVSNGILFNHESPRRGETFVSRKITRGLAQILAGKQEKIYLGNLEARRDWGFAPEYVEAMWMMLQHPQPDDFVIGTGQSHSVLEFAREAFGYVGLDWQEYVATDPRYFRPVETPNLVAQADKARRVLGWQPRVAFPELVRIMVDADLEAFVVPAPGEGRRIIEKQCGGWYQWQAAAQESLTAI